MAITLKDVASLCHVHPSTVSRVLRGKENLKVSDETRKKIFAAAQKLHYQPDQTARSLRLKKSNAIGLVIPNISSPYFFIDLGYGPLILLSDHCFFEFLHLMNVLTCLERFLY